MYAKKKSQRTSGIWIIDSPLSSAVSDYTRPWSHRRAAVFWTGVSQLYFDHGNFSGTWIFGGTPIFLQPHNADIFFGHPNEWAVRNFRLTVHGTFGFHRTPVGKHCSRLRVTSWTAVDDIVLLNETGRRVIFTATTARFTLYRRKRKFITKNYPRGVCAEKKVAELSPRPRTRP